MRRILIKKPGGHRRLEIVDADDPTPKTGEVRIAVRAIGVNFADIAVRLGVYDAVKTYPVCPGFEVSGTITARGAGVESLCVGDPVVAITRFGGYADTIVAPADQVMPLPAGFGFAAAAALPVNLATAWYALIILAHAERGERVLVHSAAGGVGLAAVQIARQLGLAITGVVGHSDKADVARRFGAERVLVVERSSSLRDVLDAGPFDIVLDAGGPATLRTSSASLAPRGRLIVYGFSTMFDRGSQRLSWPRLAWRFLRLPRFNPLDLVMRNVTVAGFNLVHLFNDASLRERMRREIMQIATHGDFIQPPLTEVPFESPAEAHRLLESGRTTGKILLTVD